MEFLGYTEEINRFVFRNFGAITIPKSIRKVAYTLQIDLEIVSIARDGYKNFKSRPAFGFYGYAVIVLRDFAEIQIPIEQPRQTIYYDRIESAYSNWYSLYLANVASANVAATQENVLVPIGAAVGAFFNPTIGECIQPPVFVELPIREVYVKCGFGTTFSIEVSHWLPNPVNYGGCAYDGSSGQIDDENKDSGLPENGSQPSVAGDPENPYAGFPQPSNQLELGEFFNDKQDNIDLSNSDNTEEEIQWDFYIIAFFLNNVGVGEQGTCQKFITLTGKSSDLLTIEYYGQAGIASNGEIFELVRFIWKGNIVAAPSTGFRNGTVLQCDRRVAGT